VAALVRTAARLETHEHPARCQSVAARAVGRRLNDPALLGLDKIADHGLTVALVAYDPIQ
jgi:hypothetical protein